MNRVDYREVSLKEFLRILFDPEEKKKPENQHLVVTSTELFNPFWKAK